MIAECLHSENCGALLLGDRQYLLGKAAEMRIEYVYRHLDGIEVEFPVVDQGSRSSPAYTQAAEAWAQLLPQLRPSPHQFTNM